MNKEKEQPKEDVKVAAPAGHPAEKKFELREGDVQLFHNTQKGESLGYELWGRALLPGGQLKFIRLWKAEAKSGREYFKGYNLDAVEDFKNLSAPPEDKHPGHTVLFYNETFDNEATERRRPMYTGIVKHDEESFRISLWNKQGPKGEFYSGLITPEMASEGTEDLPAETEA